MSEQNLQKIPKDLIRTETALSRFPIHRLSKGAGDITINIKTENKKGELKTSWRVSHNSDFGQPTALAYKLDTLLINRRIEEAGKPVPKLIKLGSLSEICRELAKADSGKNRNNIKNSLLQNAAAFITAKFSYKATDKTEKYIEIADTRYAVIFTGETLPNNDKADATYILLHDLYREILNSAQTRPLDYDYLKELTPMAQRFYELLSYQIYGAIKNKTVAKMLYSEFCMYAPQTRFFDWNQVRPQMYRLHKPHKKSGYIKSIICEEFRHEDGTLDWKFIYVPGEKAKGEYNLATNKRLKRTVANPKQPFLIPEESTPELLPDVELTFSNEEEELVSKIRKFKVSEKKARELVKSHREAVEREILVFPSRLIGMDIRNPSGLFIKAVEEDYEPPEVFLEIQKTEKDKKRTKRQKTDIADKAEREKTKAWHKAKQKLLAMPKDERNKLWEEKRKLILKSDKFKDADEAKLNVLNFAIEGMIQSEIIADFMNEERLNDQE